MIRYYEKYSKNTVLVVLSKQDSGFKKPFSASLWIFYEFKDLPLTVSNILVDKEYLR